MEGQRIVMGGQMPPLAPLSYAPDYTIMSDAEVNYCILGNFNEEKV